MRCLVVIGVVLVAGIVADIQVPVVPGAAFGYHQNVGIPQAEKIKKLEQEIQERQINSRIVGGNVAAVNAHPFLVSSLLSLQMCRIIKKGYELKDITSQDFSKKM